MCTCVLSWSDCYMMFSLTHGIPHQRFSKYLGSIVKMWSCSKMLKMYSCVVIPLFWIIRSQAGNVYASLGHVDMCRIWWVQRQVLLYTQRILAGLIQFGTNIGPISGPPYILSPDPDIINTAYLRFWNQKYNRLMTSDPDIIKTASLCPQIRKL